MATKYKVMQRKCGSFKVLYREKNDDEWEVISKSFFTKEEALMNIAELKEDDNSVASRVSKIFDDKGNEITGNDFDNVVENIEGF